MGKINDKDYITITMTLKNGQTNTFKCQSLYMLAMTEEDPETMNTAVVIVNNSIERIGKAIAHSDNGEAIIFEGAREGLRMNGINLKKEDDDDEEDADDDEEESNG